jgi:hypothetical protein
MEAFERGTHRVRSFHSLARCVFGHLPFWPGWGAEPFAPLRPAAGSNPSKVPGTWPFARGELRASIRGQRSQVHEEGSIDTSTGRAAGSVPFRAGAGSEGRGAEAAGCGASSLSTLTRPGGLRPPAPSLSSQSIARRPNRPPAGPAARRPPTALAVAARTQTRSRPPSPGGRAGPAVRTTTPRRPSPFRATERTRRQRARYLCLPMLPSLTSTREQKPIERDTVQDGQRARAHSLRREPEPERASCCDGSERTRR